MIGAAGDPDHPVVTLLREIEIAFVGGEAADLRKVGDPAQPERRAHPGIGQDGLARRLFFTGHGHELPAGDFLPGEQLLAGDVHDGFVALAALRQVHERLASERLARSPGQDFSLGRLVHGHVEVSGGGVGLA